MKKITFFFIVVYMAKSHVQILLLGSTVARLLDSLTAGEASMIITEIQ